MSNARPRLHTVFEQLPASAIPDKLSDLLYDWRGIATWPDSEATVHTCRFTPDMEIVGYGNYLVSFSYRAGNKLIEKSISINGDESAPPYRSGETFFLKFDPKRPSRYYCATQRSGTEILLLVLFCVLLGLVGAFFVIGLYPH